MLGEQLTIKEIQDEAKRLLKIFHDFCIQNDLKYFIAYGTLLGQVRHGGPIPWDDDIDVVMPRPDYEKFNKIFHSSEGSKTKLFKAGDHDYPVIYSKLISLNTTMTEDYATFPSDYGVFIDIFPLDGMPNKNIQFHLKKIKFLYKIMQISHHFKVPQQTIHRPKNILTMVLGFFGKIASREFYITTLNKYLKLYSYDLSPTVGVLMLKTTSNKVYFHKDELTSSKIVDYDGIEVISFTNAESILQRFYGENWQTPIKRHDFSHGLAQFAVDVDKGHN